jgi:hypothetical protein
VVLAEDHRSVVPAKAEGIAHHQLNIALLRFVEGEVQLGVDLGIVREVIDRRRDDALVPTP